MFRQRNLTVSLALECALLFLAISVFSWGVQAKLALHHTDRSKISTTNSMAKLATDKHCASSIASLKAAIQPRLNWETRYFAASVFLLQGHNAAPVSLVQNESRSRIPGRYILHGSNLMLRPPPVRL